MNRIREFEDAQWPIIVPIPDGMTIVHGPARFGSDDKNPGGECVMVESPTLCNSSDVEEFVKDKTKMDWIMPIPSRVTGEFKDFTQGNPHKNGRGCWVWLLIKV